MTQRLPVRVYYEDTDFAGIVYYANYLKYMERGRTELLRAAGIDQSQLKAAHGLVFVVTRVEIDYRRPALFDDLLSVETTIGRLGSASVTMTQRVMRGEAELVSALVRLGCVDATGRPTRLPKPLQAQLIDLDG